jgi:hypothetical protein
MYKVSCVPLETGWYDVPIYYNKKITLEIWNKLKNEKSINEIEINPQYRYYEYRLKNSDNDIIDVFCASDFLKW